MSLTATYLILAALIGSPLVAQADSKPATVHRIIAGPTKTKELSSEILAMDKALFDAIFNDCNPAALATMLTDDFEFYHDKGGQTASSASQFTGSIASMCERQKAGSDYRANRQLVQGSSRIYPLNNYGAIQIGEHHFYEKKDRGKNGNLLEIAKFTHLWKKTEQGWKLAEVLSYDHQAAASATTP